MKIAHNLYIGETNFLLYTQIRVNKRSFVSFYFKLKYNTNYRKF